MTDSRTENDLELAIRLVRSGQLPMEQLAPAVLGSELVVLVEGTPEPGAIDPLVVHRGQDSFFAVFTAADRVPAELGRGRNALTMQGRLLVSGARSDVGIVVNPGSDGAMEIPPSALAALREFSTTPPPRYFVRERIVEGENVPVSIFRRRMTPDGPIDERLTDFDTWTDDRHHTVDRAIRFPLDAEIEEISSEAAQDVFDMVARRTYTPLRRR